MYNFRKEHKYYNVHLQTNLFGSTSIICSWGSINSKRTGTKIILCDNDNELQKILNNILKRRSQRGYILYEN